MMDASGPASHSDAGGFMRTVAKIVRFRRTAGRGKNGAETGTGLISDDARGGFKKVKFTEYLDDASALSRSDYVDDDEEKKRHHQLRHREDMESLLAELFASVSAIKAAYAQLQIAESPYDPDTIQSADNVVVSELKCLSQLKRAYVKNQTHVPGCGGSASGGDPRLVAEAQEQRNLLKTFQITARKLERDLQQKDSEVLFLKNQLSETEMLNRWTEERFHRHGSLRTLDGLHLSALDPTHFLTVLRYAVKSVRSFVRLMVKEMERAGWDLAAAAGSISPDILSGQPEHLAFAFESYVCKTVFSGFQNHDFGLGGRSGLPDRRRCFEEFAEAKAASPKEMLNTQNGAPPFPVFQRFCREKYLALVHPRMEASFFGNLNQRRLITAAGGFPGTEFFVGFAEVARRVWLLHRLFFSFEREAEAAIFQVARGCRFSEVYMESVAEDPGEWGHVVGFTVVPGFKVGKTVIQCRVYPARAAAA